MQRCQLPARRLCFAPLPATSQPVLPPRRCFYQWDKKLRDETRDHIGTHPVILEQIVKHKDFDDYMRQTARAIRSALAVACPSTGETCPEVVVACFCRAGEKRSVGLATLLRHCMRHCVRGALVKEPEHLSEWYWWRTCKGMCARCQVGGSRHQVEAGSVLEQAALRFQEIWEQER